MSEKFQIEVTNKENYALNMIKGLPEDAFYMLTQEKRTATGGILEGTQKNFEELLSALQEDVDYRLSPRSRLSYICSVIEKIEALYGNGFESFF